MSAKGPMDRFESIMQCLDKACDKVMPDWMDMAHMRPPRLLTFFLKRSTPLKPAKGSAKRQSSAYAIISPASGDISDLALGAS